jgi:hypothetical protein
MKVALVLGEIALVLGVAAALALGAGGLAGWLADGLWHPLAVAVPAGVVLRLSRGRHPLLAFERWHGTAVRRLDDRG